MNNVKKTANTLGYNFETVWCMWPNPSPATPLPVFLHIVSQATSIYNAYNDAPSSTEGNWKVMIHRFLFRVLCAWVCLCVMSMCVCVCASSRLCINVCVIGFLTRVSVSSNISVRSCFVIFFNNMCLLDYMYMCVCVCVCIGLCVDVALNFSMCVSVSNKFVRTACVCPFVSTSAYIEANLCLPVCYFVFTWKYIWCVYYLSLTSVCVFGCLNVSFYLPEYARQYLCFRLLMCLPSSTDSGEDRLWKNNSREAGTSASVDQKRSGRGLTS